MNKHGDMRFLVCYAKLLVCRTWTAMGRCSDCHMVSFGLLLCHHMLEIKKSTNLYVCKSLKPKPELSPYAVEEEDQNDHCLCVAAQGAHAMLFVPVLIPQNHTDLHSCCEKECNGHCQQRVTN